MAGARRDEGVAVELQEHRHHRVEGSTGVADGVDAEAARAEEEGVDGKDLGGFYEPASLD